MAYVGGFQVSTGSGSSALIKVKPNLLFGKAGGKIVRTGDSIGAGNGGNQYSIHAGIQALVKTRIKSANLTQPTYTTNRSGGGNTMHDIWVTGLATLKSDLGADGGEIWANGIINDVIGLAGNDATGPWSIDQAAGFLDAGIQSVMSLYPATRFLIFGPACAGGERWILDPATGKPIGSGNSTGSATDAGIRAADQALANVCSRYPNNVRYVSVYDSFWAQAAVVNPASASSGFMSQDGLHPSLLGLNAMTDKAAASVEFVEYRTPGTIIAPSRYDLGGGDWEQEVRAFLQRHLTSGSGSLPHPGIFNRFCPVNLNAFAQFGYPANIADAGLEGGAVKFSQAGVQMLTPAIYATPKTGTWGFVIQGSFNTIAANMTAQFGLSNAAGTQAFTVGIDQPTSATKYVRYEANGGAPTKTASGGANADNADHTWYFVHQPTEVGNDIIDVYSDQNQIFHINPGGTFPTTAVGLAASGNTNAGFSIIKRAAYFFNE